MRLAFCSVLALLLASANAGADSYQCSRFLPSEPKECDDYGACNSHPSCTTAWNNCTSWGMCSSWGASYEPETGVCGCNFACNPCSSGGGGGTTGGGGDGGGGGGCSDCLCDDLACDDACWWGGYDSGGCYLGECRCSGPLPN
jgi:hypothetical protein